MVQTWTMSEEPVVVGSEERAWLVLAVGADRQHGGNDGYDDEPDAHYSWDDTVPNHASIAVGDRIVLWDKSALLGASTIEQIATGREEKILRRCPDCGLSGIKARRTLSPRYKCFKCKSVFDVPVTRIATVTTYRSRHDAGWVDLDGRLDGPRLRALCEAPRSQLSLRPLRWSAFVQALAEPGSHELLNRLVPRELPALAGGHRRSSVRVRLGQRAFRQYLLSRYGESCAITGPAPAAVLEACHLYSYAIHGEHHLHGGLLLRRDLHRLFDAGELAVDPASWTVDVRPSLAAFPTYRSLAGARLCVEPSSGQADWLARHWAQHRPA